MVFDTSVLDEALARRRTAYEQERQILLAEVLRLLDDLAPRYGIQQAYVFGSLVTPGRFTPASDVDIAVEKIDPVCFFEVMGEFSMLLERDVDLVELSKCHFAHRIREKGILWEQTI